MVPSSYTIPQKATFGLIVASLGVVYGDIGTSCLYGLRMCFTGSRALPVTSDNILGILSLIFWSLAILISIKYLVIVLRADNNGEGGVLALMTLLMKAQKSPHTSRGIILLLGLFGAALMYGDGLITPVITVLSSVEGLTTFAPQYGFLVVPICLIILLFLFSFQKYGSGKIGAVFGPLMLVWFTVIGFLGLLSIAANPVVLSAVDPRHAVAFFMQNHIRGFFTLGTVFLVLTGGEALYQDIGHFGKSPIRAGWFYIVFPALILNYFGQGAFLLRCPSLTENLFYRLAPQWAFAPLFVLANVATIIASQAVISGVFSLARQTVQLGFFPRLAIIHTSNIQIGQVYVPVFNGLLCAGTIILVLAFKKSDSLAGAYGVAVAMTMLITTLLLYLAMLKLWKWNIFASTALSAVFISMNIAFLFATLMKIKDGGWISLAVAATVFVTNLTWDRGRRQLRQNIATAAISMKDFIADVVLLKPIRVPGISVFLAGNQAGVPRTLLHNYKHNKIIHEKVVILTVVTVEIPHVHDTDRFKVEELGNGFYWLTLYFGFSETPDIPKALEKAQVPGLYFDPMQTTFFLGRETLLASRKKRQLPNWRKGVFLFLSRNSCDASKYFSIPPNRVIEIGVQIEI
jgi:KUP system potassium uptake protein